MTAPIEVRAWQADGTPRKNAVKLPAETFDGHVHEPLMHQAVKVYLANQRQGTTLTKTRSFVSGGNQKPWRQKGTGRARQGSIRSPLWPGGGTTFGPTRREYRLGMPRKMRQLARKSALNARAREQALTVVAPLAFDAPKTKRMAELLGAMGLDGHKVLVLTNELNTNVLLSSRNIPGVDVMRFADASTYDILHADSIVIEEGALGDLEQGAEVEHVPVTRKAKKAKAEEKGEKGEKEERAKKPAGKKPAAHKPAAAAHKPAAKHPAKKAEKPKAAAKQPKAAAKKTAKKPGKKKD
jgi:large subunit ribosomal protein L4